MTEHAPDYSLYLVTDPRPAGGRSVEEVVERALAGGVTAVQLRDKGAPSRALLATARILRRLTRSAGAALIVDDRLDIALAAGADGVHVGREDLPATDARRLLGPDHILGVTAASEDEARRAVEAGADYLGCNAVFPTPTKTDTGPPLGLAGLRRLAAAVRVPVVAIGGINAANAADVVAAGVAGIAVVSAIMAAADPEDAARTLRSIVDRGRTRARGGTPP